MKTKNQRRNLLTTALLAVSLAGGYFAYHNDDNQATPIILKTVVRPVGEQARRLLQDKLHAAVQANDAAKVMLLLEKGADPGSHGSIDQHSALTIALSMGHTELARSLLPYLDKTTFDTAQRAIFYTARHGDLALLNTLITFTGHAPDALLPEHSAATQCEIYQALEYGHLEVTKRLWDLRPNCTQWLEVALKSGQTETVQWLLHTHPEWQARFAQEPELTRFAVQSGKPELLQLIEQYGATKLLPEVAAEYGKLDILRYYHDHGYKLQSDNEDSLAIIAARHNQQAVIEYLQTIGITLESPDPPANAESCPSLANIAAAAGHIPLTQWLLKQPSLRRTDLCNGDTLLHSAIQTLDIAMIDTLLKQGLARDEPNQQGDTVLHLLSSRYLDKRAQALFTLLLDGTDNGINAQNANGTTPLLIALQQPDRFFPMALLDAGAEVGLSDNDGQQALHQLFISNHSADTIDAILPRLLKQGADINAPDYSGQTPLHYAATEVVTSDDETTGLCEKLLPFHPALEIADQQGQTPLHKAVNARNLHNVTALLKAGANPNVVDAMGNTPLHYAAGQATTELLDVLLTHKANPRTLNLEGKTPLALSANTKILTHLQATGVNLTTNSPSGESLIAQLARRTDKQEVLPLLQEALKAGTDLNAGLPLHLSIRFNSPIISAFLLKAGVDTHSTDQEGNTPLHMAVRTRSLTHLQLLLKYKVNINTPNRHGRTALQQSIDLNEPTIANRLLQAGANIHTKDRDQRTPLHTALATGQSTLASKLITLGSDVNARSKGEWTPLHFAAQLHNPALIKQLLDKGAVSGIRSWGQQTALDLANLAGHQEVIALLKTAPTTLSTTPDTFDNTALHWAARDLDLPQVQRLLQQGMEVNAPNRYGETPLQLAVRAAPSNPESAYAVITALLDKGADAKVQDALGNTLLQDALQQPVELRLVETLLAHGVSPTSHNRAGETLYHLLSRQNLAVIQTLWTTGEHPHLWSWAMMHPQSKELVAWLLRQGESPNSATHGLAMEEAIFAHQYALLDSLRQAGGRLQAAPNDTEFLDLLILIRDYPAVLVLLQQADYIIPWETLAEPTDHWLQSLSGNAGNAVVPLVTALLEHGAKQHLQGVEVLKAAIQKDAEQLLMLYQQAGLLMSNQQELIHYAASHNAVRSLAYLHQQGAALDTPDSAGNTPLHHAMRGQALDAVRWLLTHGARSDVLNQQQQTVLDQLATITSYARLKNTDETAFVQQVHELLPEAKVSAYLLSNLISQSRYNTANAVLLAWPDSLTQLSAQSPTKDNPLQTLADALGMEESTPKAAIALLDTLVAQGTPLQLIRTVDNDHAAKEYLTTRLAKHPDILRHLLTLGYRFSEPDEVQALVETLFDATDTNSTTTLHWLLQQPDLPHTPHVLTLFGKLDEDRLLNPTLAEKSVLLRDYVHSAKNISPLDPAILLSLLKNPTVCQHYPDWVLQQIQRTDYRQAWLAQAATEKAQNEAVPHVSFLYGLTQPALLAALQQQPGMHEQLQQYGIRLLMTDPELNFVAHWKALQALGADLAQIDEAGNTLLHQVLDNPQFNQTSRLPTLLFTVDFLLEQQPALASIGNMSGQQALHRLMTSTLPPAIRQRLAERLRKANAPLDAADKNGNTPLHMAIDKQQWDSVAWLLAQGAAVNISNQRGETPLHLLVDTAQFDQVKTLIQHGSDINVADKDGNTPLHRIASKPCQEKTCLPQIALFKLLLEHHADSNRQNADGETPLFMSAYSGNVPLAELLLTHQADPNLSNHLGDQPLHIALYRRHRLLADLLLTHGAKLETANWEGINGVDAIRQMEDGGLAALASQINPNLKWTTTIQATQIQPTYLYDLLQAQRLAAVAASRHYQKPRLFRARDDNNTLLHAAAAANDGDFIKVLIANHHPLEVTNAKQATPLIVAIQHKATVAIRHLLAAGATLPKNAWRLAVQTDDLNTVQALWDASRQADKRLDPNEEGMDGKTALYFAVAQNNPELVLKLLSVGANANAKTQPTPLLLAVEHGNLAITRALLDAGASLQVRTEQGRTPLLHAIGYFVTQVPDASETDLKDRLKLVDLLLEKGAKLTEQDSKRGDTALHIGIPVYGMAQHLLAKGADIHALNKELETPFFQAVRAQYPERDARAFLQSLLNQGIDPNDRNRYGESALQVAIRHNNEIALTLLLESGVDPNVIKKAMDDNTGYTLSMYVIASPYISSERKLPLLKLLNKAGADKQALNNNGENALFVALRQGENGREQARWLLEQGISANVTNLKGQTPLHILLENTNDQGISALLGLDELLALLLKQGADLQARDMNSQTALHYALKDPRSGWVQRLLKAGIDPNIQDNTDLTALHQALSKPPATYPGDPNAYDPATVQLLLDFKADPNRRNAKGQTALHLAYVHGHLEWVTPLLAAGADKNLVSYAGKRAEEEKK